jgi:guanylate kinase
LARSIPQSGLERAKNAVDSSSTAATATVIVIVAGPGGAGKGALIAGLLRRDPRLWLSRSWTTRSRRPDDAPDAYTYVDRPAFEARIEQGGFLEWEEFLGELYGTPSLAAPAGRDVLLEIELDGARQVREQHPGAVMLFVVPPSREVQEERLRGRGDPPERVRERVRMAEELDATGRALADHVVVNDDLGRAVEEVAAILESHRMQPNP